MPVLSASRRQARVVACLSNLRQLGTAFQLYLNENKGKGVSDIVGNSDLGPLSIEPILLPNRATGSQAAVMFCPETTESPIRVSGGGDAWHYAYAGGVFRPWGVPDAPPSPEAVGAPFRGSSYGMNGWLLNIGYGPSYFVSTNYMRDAYISLPTKDADRIPLYGDCTRERAYPLDTDPPPLSLAPYEPGAGGMHRSYSMSHTFCMPRHGRVVNLVFLDGHASAVPLGELWQLKWNNVWIPTNVTLPPS
jgi:prepilin-type processing-associated H-X9-DG protein